MDIEESERHARHGIAEEFMTLYVKLYDSQDDPFSDEQEIAERLLQEWADTLDFPEVHGKWIMFRDQFLNWMTRHYPGFLKP